MESENAGTGSPHSSSQITPLIEQCQNFDARIRELQADVKAMRKERQAERQSFIKTITSIRDEIRADVNRNQDSIISTKTAKVDTALTEYSDTVHTLRASLDALAAELGRQSGQDKPSLDLRKTVDDLRNSMGVVATYSEAQQQEFRGKVKAFDETTDRS
jgi:predicted RNase H-like nuclease (RuvC/YqgF family)